MKSKADEGVQSVEIDQVETVAEAHGEEPPQGLDEGTPPELAEVGRPAKAGLRHRVATIAKRPAVQGWTLSILALGGAAALVFVPAGGTTPPQWSSVSLDFLVPLATAAVLYVLQQGARSREEEFDEKMLKLRQQHETELERRKEQLARDLTKRERELEEELLEREEVLERELQKASREFLLKLEKIQRDRQVSVARQRHRLAARLSIADHIGDINGHMSAIDSILNAMSRTEPSETTGSDRDSTREMRTGEAELRAITRTIRIPARLRRILDMEDHE